MSFQIRPGTPVGATGPWQNVDAGPRPQTRVVQQPLYGANLLATSLTVKTILRGPLYGIRLRAPVAQQPPALANLNLTTLVGVVAGTPFQAWQQPSQIQLKRVQQPDVSTYNNTLSNLVQQGSFYFLNDSGFSVQIPLPRTQPTYENRLPLFPAAAPADPPIRNAPVMPLAVRGVTQDLTFDNLLTMTLAQAPPATPVTPYDLTVRYTPRFTPQDVVQPNLLSSTLNDPGKPPRSMELMNPIRAVYLTRFDQQNFTLQLLTFVPPTLPYNFYDWQLPKPIPLPTARLDSYQGQNPEFIPPPVTPPVVPDNPAPGPAGKKRHRRLLVQIDGQDFAVASETEAVELLTRARAIAERQAERKASRVEKRLRKKPDVPVVELKLPSIVVPAELREATAPLIADIERLYRKASVAMELRLLLAKQMAAEDDDEDILLLS